MYRNAVSCVYNFFSSFSFGVVWGECESVRVRERT